MGFSDIKDTLNSLGIDAGSAVSKLNSNVATVNKDAVVKKIFVIRLEASFKRDSLPEGDNFSESDFYEFNGRKYSSFDGYIEAMADEIISDESNIAVQQVRGELSMIDTLLDFAVDMAKSIKEQKIKITATKTKMKTDFATERAKLTAKMATDAAQYAIPLVTASAAGPGTAIAAPLAKGITNIYNALIGIYSDLNKFLDEIIDDVEPSFDDQKELIGTLVDMSKTKIESFGIDINWFSFINAKFKQIELLLK